MIPVPKDAIDEIGRLAAEVSRFHEIVCEQDDRIADLLISHRNAYILVHPSISYGREALRGDERRCA